MTLDIEAIKARAGAATPGPWDAGKYDGRYGIDAPSGDVLQPDMYYSSCRIEVKPEDAQFIAHAREDIPALIAEADEMRAVLRDVQWGSYTFCGDFPACPSCHNDEQAGHAPDCALAKLLE